MSSQNPFSFDREKAEAGDAEAQYKLGLYHAGRDFSYTESVKWYRKAAAQGHEMAQWYLACYYKDGFGVKQDNELAYTYYYLSYLCSDDEYFKKTLCQSFMQDLEGKGFLKWIFWTKRKISSSQVKKAKRDAHRMFEEIQRHKEHEKHRNITLKPEVKNEHLNIMREMREKKAKKNTWKVTLKRACKLFIIFGIVVAYILFLKWIINI